MSVTVSATVPSRAVALDLRLPAETTTAVLGGNGAGKTTLLEVIAGLVAPDPGRVAIADDTVTDIGPAHRLLVPPHRRSVGLLSQRPLLFPHLNVRDNVAFAPRTRGLSRPAARGVAEHWLAAVGAHRWADRRPASLSGGQAQRVALARALAGEPRVLLLDEPLAALDVETAAEMRLLLHDVLTGRTAVLVTHEATDAAVLADHAVVLDAGRVVDTGAVATLMRRPRHAFTAHFWGLNLVRGRAAGRNRITTPVGPVAGVAAEPFGSGEEALAAFAPETVTVTSDPPPPTPDHNQVLLPLISVRPHGHRVIVRAGDVEAHLPVTAVGTLPSPGTPVHVGFPAATTQLYPAIGR